MPQYLISLSSTQDTAVTKRSRLTAADAAAAATFALSALNWARTLKAPHHLLDTWTVATSPGPLQPFRIVATGKVEND
jgi:hypothetical protein